MMTEIDGETATMFPKEARLGNLYSTPLYIDVIKRHIKKGHDYVEVILYQQTCKGSFQVVVSDRNIYRWILLGQLIRQRLCLGAGQQSRKAWFSCPFCTFQTCASPADVQRIISGCGKRPAHTQMDSFRNRVL